MVRAAALAIASLLAGCDRSVVVDEKLRTEAMMSGIERDAFAMRIARLESNAVPDYAAMRPGKTGWQWMNTRGQQIRISLEEVVPKGNGSQVRVAILNPMAVGFAECTLELVWGETDAAGNSIPSTQHRDIMKIGKPLPAGDFAFPTFTLTDIPPSKLGMVTAKEIYCLKNT